MYSSTEVNTRNYKIILSFDSILNIIFFLETWREDEIENGDYYYDYYLLLYLTFFLIIKETWFWISFYNLQIFTEKIYSLWKWVLDRSCMKQNKPLIYLDCDYLFFFCAKTNLRIRKRKGLVLLASLSNFFWAACYFAIR